VLTTIKTNSKQKPKTRQRTINKLRINNRQRIKIKQQPSSKQTRTPIKVILRTRINLVGIKRRKNKNCELYIFYSEYSIEG
jgi:hypothetical protein